MREELLLDVPHRQVVFTIPRMLRIFFKYKRWLPGSLCRAAVQALIKYFQPTTGNELRPGVVAVIQSFGQKINFHPHIHLLVTDGSEDFEGEFIARTTSHIPDKSQVMIRYFGLYANPHRGKLRKAEEGQPKLLIIEEECPRRPRRGWAAMIRKVYEVDPLTCSQCGGTMKVIAFITDFSVVDHIINQLKLTFIADRPPPPRVASQELLVAAETYAEYFS